MTVKDTFLRAGRAAYGARQSMMLVGVTGRLLHTHLTPDSVRSRSQTPYLNELFAHQALLRTRGSLRPPKPLTYSLWRSIRNCHDLR